MTNIQVARDWIQGMNEHDVDKMFRVCTEDLFGEEIAEPHPMVGRSAVADSYVDLFEGFPDCKSEIINEFSGDGQTLIEVRWTGTNTGSFRGTPPTNKPVDCRIAYIFAFQGENISRITEYYDGATVASQLS
ncbi:MAG: hypothetical protein A2029_10215 [Chloroflexi bacterium RBG_19FT_COMBO_47_9]|nr:MAG: hypothetical protein A2029_10215 [Chloroflexi bacterium RBG_19FT_COMBO_47_9]